MAATERYRLQRGAPLETNRYVREVLEEKGAEVKIAVAFKVVPDDQDIQSHRIKRPDSFYDAVFAPSP